ncbi:DUF4870 domain-containing protein [Robertkochia sediminum]|uniref:DUF4870 domain-containing protein n=1 Tax=Robertkochia sediminum TaxID=2785326 RepID=UPI001933A8B9|nr:hypothetical protein [Robertkochia sediminum]MBL7473461.1 hypothetical protein [Robertkochia sediminum]
MQTVENEGKTTAIIAYLTLIGALIAIFMNQEPKNAFARFHIRQAFGVHLIYWAMGLIIGSLDIWMLQYSYWILFFALWAYGFVGAIQGKWYAVPVIGPWFQKWFTFIQ